MKSLFPRLLGVSDFVIQHPTQDFIMPIFDRIYKMNKISLKILWILSILSSDFSFAQALCRVMTWWKGFSERISAVEEGHPV